MIQRVVGFQPANYRECEVGTRIDPAVRREPHPPLRKEHRAYEEHAFDHSRRVLFRH